MKRREFLAAGAAAGAVAASGSSAWAKDYPSRPIQLIVPWAAGGGTDAVARILGSVMQKDLGVPVNVVNRTGGSGVVGHDAIARAKPDGYTIGLATVEIGMLHWQGLTKLTYADYDILGVVNQDPAGITVSADSKYKTAEELIAAIKKQPKGSFTASGTGQGGIWNVALDGLMMDQGMPADQVTWIPSQGAAPGLTDMVAGGVSMVTASLPEAQAMIEAGRVRALATMASKRLDKFPDVPTIKEALGSDWTMAAWRGVFAPKGLPDPVKAVLVKAVDEAYHSDDYKKFMTSRGLGMIYMPPKDAEAFAAKADASFGKVMKAAGLAKG
ncbi:tripartite tricarboxylate transporter substrate binding protein [Acidimangrovimonas sediminis]|uniref:tripartite tricarboxylate transporter substrate binding protein n=1 Tax=Acidimangrovimonas sediminis TaxID=2056283 RepID=UPI000C7FC1C5|nr:tripartite tricarboxylate transporter substrate binding protein [Acidimangrovimonas sediminis]